MQPGVVPTAFNGSHGDWSHQPPRRPAPSVNDAYPGAPGHKTASQRVCMSIVLYRFSDSHRPVSGCPHEQPQPISCFPSISEETLWPLLQLHIPLAGEILEQGFLNNPPIWPKPGWWIDPMTGTRMAQTHLLDSVIPSRGFTFPLKPS